MRTIVTPARAAYLSSGGHNDEALELERLVVGDEVHLHAKSKLW